MPLINMGKSKCDDRKLSYSQLYLYLTIMSNPLSSPTAESGSRENQLNSKAESIYSTASRRWQKGCKEAALDHGVHADKHNYTITQTLPLPIHET